MTFYNWIRHRDAEGNHFDVREDAAAPEGASPIKGYPVHRAMIARDSKAKVQLRADAQDGYADVTKAKLEKEIARRNGERQHGPIVPVSDLKDDLVAALLVDDESPLDAPIAEESAAPLAEDNGQDNASDGSDEPPATGDHTTDAGAPGGNEN